MTSAKHPIEKIPYGKLGLIALPGCKELGKQVDRHLVQKRKQHEFESGKRYHEDLKASYLISIKNIRFANGEGKALLEESVRGKDIYILTDVGNYSCTYEMFGIENHMGPDEHFQDIKRTISAIGGKARRISVIMPFLYAGRQHKRKTRESLDCALALKELERLGVENVFTFDAHDPRIENAIPLIGFENLHPTYNIIRALVEKEKELIIDRSQLLVISPDTGAMDRAIYYASVLELDVGLFYKRRNYTQVVNGKNPIIQHEYMGADVEGKDVLIVDDMVASGESISDIARELKDRGAKNIYTAVTFALFTEGIDRFNRYYQEGLIKRLYSTNLTYVPESVKTCEWFVEVDMSRFIAALIDKLNYDESISSFFDATDRIDRLFDDE